MREMRDKKKDRQKELAAIWDITDINSMRRFDKIASTDFCGKMTVRELAAVALADEVNFPKGLDTPLCIGDFEESFHTNVLRIEICDDDYLCLSGDPHGGMS